MRVQMKTKIGGFRNGVEWPDIGGTIDVPDHEADGLIGNGYAVPLEQEDLDGTAEAAADDQSAPAGAEGDTPADADGDGATGSGEEAVAGVDEASARSMTPTRASKKR